ncbi:MAG: CRISPR-associated helicase Cas3' [Actinobacteria bacterium]|nr:CRISPR-associated helicase Cas3' [Actinomycetota bacterium]
MTAKGTGPISATVSERTVDTGTHCYAHSPNAAGEWHTLEDHLVGTAELAAEFAAAFGGSDFARVLGLDHDVGKAGCTFSGYLRMCASAGPDTARAAFPARDHKTAGAVLASELDERWGTFAAMAILGHHGGIPDLGEAKERLRGGRSDASIADTLQRARRALPRLALEPVLTVPDWVRDRPSKMEEQLAHARDVEMFVRLCFSALVDADWLDTEHHFQPASSASRRHGTLEGLIERFATYRRTAFGKAPETEVNRARREIRNELMDTVQVGPGLYQLPAPTGAGKTLFGLEWALRHASIHGQRRIVTAVPFISVTDQVAAVYRSALDKSDSPVVLEHHSQVAEGDWTQRLAAENWDSPVVVTTTVRLFESLFSNRPSDCRRLHRLARSVIILDEVQALPVELLDPIVDSLRVLVDRFGATVVLMTATQPALEHLPSAGGRPAVALIRSRPEWDSCFSRTHKRILKGSAEQIAEELAHQESFLCVLNTIGDAERMARLLDEQGVRDLQFLSTRLRPADRRERIQSVRERLHDGLPCRVVSTQLVEAGVDLDFPMVYRALAPLPSLVQADGRCNRNGLLDGMGETVVFDFPDSHKPPGAYYTHGTAHTKTLLSAEPCAAWTEDAIAEWYRRLFRDPLVTTDKKRIQDLRSKFHYREVAKVFRMIDDDTVPVVVPWTPPDPRTTSVYSVLDRLSAGQPVGISAYRTLQDATVSLPRRLAEAALSDGTAEAVTPVLYRWNGEYDELLGLQNRQANAKELIW